MDFGEETERSSPGRAIALVVAGLAVVSLAARYGVMRAAPAPEHAPPVPAALAEEPAAETDGARALREGGRIDLNSASVEELRLLPRIGPRLAERIVADRAARGLYRTVDDLERVPGIGPRTLAELRPLARVGTTDPQ